MALTQRAVQRAFDEQLFGSEALLVDAFALTRAANASGSSRVVSLDGHHYPEAVSQVEWQLVYVAYTLWDRTSMVRASRGADDRWSAWPPSTPAVGQPAS